MPEGRVIHLLKQIAGSLAEAHSLGVIHRDIKPANIFLTHRGGVYDFIKLLDFGLVKAIDGREQASLTSANSMAGTPMYLSPEGIGSPDKVDARSDIYALGAVAYYLLTGTTVFDGESIIEICMKHTQEQPELPSKRLGQPISDDLEQIIMNCLEKDPANRPQTAADLILRLGECQTEKRWTNQNASNWWTLKIENEATVIQPAVEMAPQSKSAVDATLIVNLSDDE